MNVITTRRLVALAMTAAFGLAACSGSGTPASTNAPAAGTETPSGAQPSGPASSGAAALTAPTPPSASVTLQGAGATFPAPLYTTWFEQYSAKYSNIQFNYQANGSGAGITAITQQTVGFGASDAAMKDSEIAALPSGTKLLHIPTALGAVVVVYNVPGVTSLQLDSAAVAGIYLGTITNWNDPSLAANNSGVALPNLPILVCHRSDGSGTTNAFTTYLDTVSPDWHTKVGAGKDVKWPTGVGGAGNDGVAGCVKQNQGGVGYVELNYATTAQLTSAKLKNADGKFVAGSTDGVTAAAAAAVSTFPADFRQTPIINGPGAATYPIASYTYLLVYQDQKDATKGQALVAFIAWALTDGQAAETALGYAPLPQQVAQKALAELKTITTGGSPIWP